MHALQFDKPFDAQSGSAARLSLRDTAIEFEALFLAEMLKSAKVGETSGFDGGLGQQHFASFLRDAQAREMAARGTLGLAEKVFGQFGRDNGS